MKVAFLIQDLFGRGAEHATALLTRGFIAKGYEVDLVLSRIHRDKLEAGLKPFEVPDEVRLVYLKSRHARYNVWSLRRYLKTANAEVLIIVSPAYEITVALASLCLKKRPRLYTVRHTIDFALNDKLEYRNVDNSWRVKFKDWLSYGRLSGVLCVAEKVRTEMIRLHHLPEEKVHTVYNPVVDDAFMKKKGKPPSHPWLIERDVPTFVTAGAFRPEKNHLLLIEAFKIVNRTHPARLIIFGRGDLQAKYEDAIRENSLSEVVSLPGFSESLVSEVAASSGYISCSQIESFGIAIVEGLACGVPVISTDAPCGPREILKDGEYGELVPMDNPELLAQAVVRVIEHGGKKVPDEAWRRFELSRIVERYEKSCALHDGHLKEL